jgi:antitoxin VapB
MTASAKKPAGAKSTAKLFMHGRSQAVRLPKEFRFEGKEVRVSRQGDKVILEPMEKPPFDFDAWWAKLDEYLDIPFMEVPDDPPSEPDDTISFD